VEAERAFRPPASPAARRRRTTTSAGLAAGRIDGDGDDELIIGIPGRLHAQTNQPAGLVQVLLGNSLIFGHAFDAGNSNGWSVVAP
jgi:hypothetical protein